MEAYLGQIILFGGNYEPYGWAFCNGQLLQISNYTALFSIFGNVYGGDGRNTFALPDLRGRAPIHFGQGNGLRLRNIGDYNGSEQVTITNIQMPMHTHQVNPQFTNTPNETNPINAYAGALGAPVYGDTGNGPMGNAIVGLAGGNQSHNNMQPWLSINYIICIDQGLYPPRP